MKNSEFKLKHDRYKTARGGFSRILDVRCEHCDSHICYYQKDGPGILKRMYFDRIIDRSTDSEKLECAECRRVLGVHIIFEKEKRDAYRLFVGSVTKKVVKAESLNASK